MKLSRFLIYLLIFCIGTLQVGHAYNLDEQQCQEQLAKLLDVSFPKPKKIKIRAEKGSLSDQIYNFEEFQDKLMSKRPSINKFIKHFEEKHGHPPTLEQALNFFIYAKDNLVSHIRSAKNGNNDLAYFLEEAARNIENKDHHFELHKSIKQTKAEILAQPLDINNNQHYKILGKYGYTHYKGPLGELAALLRFNGVIAQSVFFKQMETIHGPTQKINSILYRAVIEKFNQINEFNAKEYIRRYPRIFREVEDDISTNEEILRGLNFILSKEVDIILKKGDMFEIVEIKNYKGGLKSSSLRTSGTQRRKGIIDQLEEVQQILELLGLEKKFKLSFLSIQGVSDQARESIEAIGVKVYDQIDKPDITPIN